MGPVLSFNSFKVCADDETYASTHCHIGFYLGKTWVNICVYFLLTSYHYRPWKSFGPHVASVCLSSRIYLHLLTTRTRKMYDKSTAQEWSCFIAGPDLWKRKLYKCSIIRVFTCPLLSWYNISSTFKGKYCDIYPVSFPHLHAVDQLWFNRLKDGSPF